MLSVMWGKLHLTRAEENDPSLQVLKIMFFFSDSQLNSTPELLFYQYIKVSAATRKVL